MQCNSFHTIPKPVKFYRHHVHFILNFFFSYSKHLNQCKGVKFWYIPSIKIFERKKNTWHNVHKQYNKMELFMLNSSLDHYGTINPTILFTHCLWNGVQLKFVKKKSSKVIPNCARKWIKRAKRRLGKFSIHYDMNKNTFVPFKGKESLG